MATATLKQDHERRYGTGHVCTFEAGVPYAVKGVVGRVLVLAGDVPTLCGYADARATPGLSYRTVAVLLSELDCIDF